MKKIFLSVLPLVLTLALILPGAATVRAETERKIEVQPAVRAALIIGAPNVADVGQPLTITVFGKHNQKPVAGAAVYALKTNELVITADNINYTTVDADYAALAKEKGVFLGYTNNNGDVVHSFTDTGRYILVAVKDGFIPGFSQITITLAAKYGLNIKAPGTAEIGQPVTFVVTERTSYSPVANAALYAKKIGEISMPQVTSTTTAKSDARGEVQAATPVAVNSAMVVQANATNIIEAEKEAAEIKGDGIFLGYSNDKGEVVYSFSNAGHYVIAAIKENYAPGFARIAITLANRKMLGIKAPNTSEVGKPVTMTIIERQTGKPVSKATVYALKIGKIISLPQPIDTIIKNESAEAAEAEKYATTAKEKGSFIGYTDDYGQLTHTFNETGRYVLVATKDGYIPGFTGIAITLAGQKDLDVKAPGTAVVDQQVTIKVVERSTQKAIEQAGVYALKINLIPVPSPSSENGTATQMILVAPPYNTEAEKYAALAKEKGFFIGYTNNDGEMIHAFNEAGLYILVATKDGYRPGFTRINILPASVKALAVIVPPEAEVNQQVNIKVVERGTHNAVAKAGVYALKIGTTSEPKPITEITRPEVTGNTSVQNYASLAKEKGSFIGWTEDNGIIAHKFADTGRYVVVAIKDDYEPGFAHITIRLVVNKTLLIKAPGKANLGEPVTITVKEKHTKEAVAQADIYAWRVGGAGEAIGLMFKAEVNAHGTVKDTFTSAAKEKGTFIGPTDNNGILVHRFTEAGYYTLVAIKSGYTPDFARIQIKPLKPFKVENPLKINAAQATTSNSSKTK